MSTSTDLPAPTGRPAGAPIDPLVEQRLARLAARQAGTSGVAASRPPAARPAAGPNRAKRRHAAKRSRAAALLMSIGTTAGLSAYFQHADAAAASNSTATAPATATATATAVVASTGTGTTMADGTFVGDTDTNKWGPVQVQITVTGGQITAVAALQTPSDDGKSVSINNRAVPVLNSEVLTAQSSDIDSVSGATYTSDSYQVSLQSAIDQAISAAVTAAV